MKLQTTLTLLITVFAGSLARPTLKQVVDEGEMYVSGTEYVKVEGTVTSGRPDKGSAYLFPAKINFRFRMEARNVSLDLQRSVHQDINTPFYTMDQSGLAQWRRLSQKNFALYQNLTLGCSMLVKFSYEVLSTYELLGSFTYNGGLYQIEHIRRHSRRRKRSYVNVADEVTTADHVVQKQYIPLGSFEGDALMPPAGTVSSQSFAKNLSYQQHSFHGNETGASFVLLKNEESDDTLPPGRHPEDGRTSSDTFLNRTKRSSDTDFIEYLVVCDYRNLQRWKEMVEGSSEEEKEKNAFDAMNEYYHFIINGVDVRFRTATSTGKSLKVVLSAIVVSTIPETSVWTEKNKLSGTTVDDAGALLSFAAWKETSYDNLPVHDHAGLFTGYNLATTSSTLTVGMAYLDNMCDRTWAVSEIEELYNALAIHIVAHELGHNVGSRHDGTGNGCPSTAQYLMAPYLPHIEGKEKARNPWVFSTCSRHAISSFIDGLGSDSCLGNEPLVSMETGTAPGLYYTPDHQCQMTYGGGAVLCREKLYGQWDSICYALQCKIPGENSCTGRIFPFEGTPCGNEKWCQQGACVDSDRAPPVKGNCVFGDDPLTSCTAANCDDYNTREVYCCSTCNGGLPSHPTIAPSTSTTASTLTTTSTSTSTTSVSTSADRITTAGQPRSDNDDDVTFELQTLVAMFVATALVI